MLLVTAQQWNEFLDKLDFVQLTGRWSLLPLDWLDESLPEETHELGRELVSSLLDIRELEDEERRQERLITVCAEYRRGLSALSLSLGATMCPPGSRVSLHYLNPEDLGQGDCLITVGSWDRVGHLVAQLASPDGEHLDSVGAEPVRREPGSLAFRDLLLFPDKGTASPRAFRSLCEATFRHARGLGGRHLSLTHLHLPQSGLGDRFAAAEVVSAVRQIVREGPGTTVDILVFSHRNFEDYKHWFESLGALGTNSPKFEKVSSQPRSEPRSIDVADTFKDLARRSSSLATEASASVNRWFSGGQGEGAEGAGRRQFDFRERSLLNELYLKELSVEANETDWANLDPIQSYLRCLQETLRWELEREGLDEPPTFIVQNVTRLASNLGESHFLHRYFRLLTFRLSRHQEVASSSLLSDLLSLARRWDDGPLEQYLVSFQEEREKLEINYPKAPVAPAGSREYVTSERERTF